MSTLKKRFLALPATITVTALLLVGCGGGGDGESASAAPGSTTAAASDATQGNGATRENPFSALVECLRDEGLEVEEPSFGPGNGGDFRNGTPPEGGSLPDRPDGESFPPDGSFPPGGGSVPPGGSFPGDGSIPPGGPGGGPGAGQVQDPTFLASILGLDASDATVTAAIETCTDQLG